MPPIQAGQPAPDFTTKDQAGAEFTLSSLRGKKKVVLAFYPFDWSPVCTQENACFTSDLPKFGEMDAEVFGISCDSMWSHKAWAEKLGLRHRLLADVKREICRSYGLHNEAIGASERATVVVGKDGLVKFVKVQTLKEARKDEEVLEALRKA